MVSRQNRFSYAIRLLRILLGTTILLLLAHLTLQYLNWEVFYQQNGQAYELANRFDLDDEASVPTWFSQILFLAIGIGAWLASYIEKKIALRRMWQIIAIGGLLFSIDEIAGLHEFVLQSLHVWIFKDAAPTSSNNAWWLVVPFILSAFGWLVWKMIHLLPRRTVILFAISIATFLTGAIAVDLLTSIVPRETFLHQGIMVAIEETFELIGSVIVVYALADYLEVHRQRELHNALSQILLRSPNSK